MAEKSLFWTTGATGDGASEYTQAETIRWLRQTFVGDDTDEGVLKNYQNELEVTGAATPVAVNTGGAIVYGFPYWNTASVNVTIPTPSGATRIDRIVLRASWAAQTVRITRVAGSEGGGAPALTQTDGTTWDISLAQVSITTGGVITVTDERVFLHPNVEVNTAMIEDDAVTNAKVADDAVDTAQIVDDAVTNAKVADDAVNTAQIVDDAVTTAKIAAGAVDTTELAADAVTTAKIAAGAVDTTELAADAVTTVKITDANVTLAKLAANSVDDTKAGDRVPQFYRRQGGSATDWNTAGSTNRTPGAVRMQAGAVTLNCVAAASVQATVTFPVAFSNKPLMFLTHVLTTKHLDVTVWTISASQLQVDGQKVDGSSDTWQTVVYWLAIGPE